LAVTCLQELRYQDKCHVDNCQTGNCQRTTANTKAILSRDELITEAVHNRQKGIFQ